MRISLLKSLRTKQVFRCEHCYSQFMPARIGQLFDKNIGSGALRYQVGIEFSTLSTGPTTIYNLIIILKIYMKKKRSRAILMEGPNGGETVRGQPIQRHEEKKVQRPIVDFLRKVQDWTQQLTFFHVPNQLLNKSKFRKIFWGLGVRNGVSDLIVPIQGGITLYVELKYNGNSLSDEQIKFFADMTKLGHGPHLYVIDAKDSIDAVEQMKVILAKYGITDFRLKGGLNA